MNKVFSVLLCQLYITFCVFGQDLQLEIDQQVWKVFKESYANMDAKAFNDLHSDDLIRVAGNTIRNKEEYAQNNIDRAIKDRNDGRKLNIDLRFDKRVANDNVASEDGYYKLTSTNKEGRISEGYGRFHVILRKIDGRWKIQEDWDTHIINGIRVTAEDFDKLDPQKDHLEPSHFNVDYVKVLGGNFEEAIFYFENNWLKLRQEAVKRNYIKSYKFVKQNMQSDSEYNFILITEYVDLNQFNQREEHFSELIAEDEDGLQLLNELKPGEFRKTLK